MYRSKVRLCLWVGAFQTWRDPNKSIIYIGNLDCMSQRQCKYEGLLSNISFLINAEHTF